MQSDRTFASVLKATILNDNSTVHSNAWVGQVWAAFVISTLGTTVGILYLPVNVWMKSFLGMGLTFTVQSTICLAKTTRDLHEAQKVTSRIDDARVQKLLAEHDPFKD
ncbi:MAG: YiaA/YiaB family inner membrane protein [Cyanobacteria bacterium J06642_2]